MTWVFKNMLRCPHPDQMEKETDKALVPWRANQSDMSSAPWCISGQFLHFLKLTFMRGMRGRIYGLWQPHLSYAYGLRFPSCMWIVHFCPIHGVCAHLILGPLQCIDVIEQCIFRVWVQEFRQQRMCMSECWCPLTCDCPFLIYQYQFRDLQPCSSPRGHMKLEILKD